MLVTHSAFDIVYVDCFGRVSCWSTSNDSRGNRITCMCCVSCVSGSFSRAWQRRFFTILIVADCTRISYGVLLLLLASPPPKQNRDRIQWRVYCSNSSPFLCQTVSHFFTLETVVRIVSWIDNNNQRQLSWDTRHYFFIQGRISPINIISVFKLNLKTNNFSFLFYKNARGKKGRIFED